MTHPSSLWLENALEITPLASQTRSKAPGRVGPALDSPVADQYPIVATYGEGAKIFGPATGPLWDCAGANASVPLGYAYRPVINAVSNAMAAGSLLSLPTVQELTTSKKFLRQCAPWAERVRWVKTGSEAVAAAVRLARIRTGRSRVLVMTDSYHGWHDWTYARFKDPRQGGSSTVYANGVPIEMGDLIQTVPYGSFPMSWSNVGALVIEAARFEPTNRSWLVTIVKRARDYGVPVIFDELVYGLRWAMGGAAEYFDVEPDLACFGKALGNGVPVACVCGSAAIMEPAGDYISGTYGGDRIGLAAAEAVLDAYRTDDIIGRLWDAGRQLWAGFEASYASDRMFRLEGYPVHWRLVGPSIELLDLALVECIKAGVLVSRASNNASAAMLPGEAYIVGQAIGDACMTVRNRSTTKEPVR